MAERKGTKFQGGLYPTVAVSDCFLALTHYYSAGLAFYSSPTQPAFVGFSLVAIAATVGTARFGFSESLFAGANEDLANLAACVGLPLIGCTFATVGGLVEPLPPTNLLALACTGAALACLVKAIPAGSEEFLKVLVNLCLFILPVAKVGYDRQDWVLFGAIALFAVAGIAVKPDRHNCILGVRRENWFHYMLGASAIGMATGLAAIAR